MSQKASGIWSMSSNQIAQGRVPHTNPHPLIRSSWSVPHAIMSFSYSTLYQSDPCHYSTFSEVTSQISHGQSHTVTEMQHALHNSFYTVNLTETQTRNDRIKASCPNSGNQSDDRNLWVDNKQMKNLKY